MYTVGQDFDPSTPVRSARTTIDVRAQRRGADGMRAAIYLPSRVGQIRVAVDVPPGAVRALCEQYRWLCNVGEEAAVSGVDFLEIVPEVDGAEDFVEGLESLLGPALGLLGPLLGMGGGGGGGLEGLLGGLLGGGGGKGGGGLGGLGALLGGGGGGGGGDLLQLLASGGLGQGAQLRQLMGLGSPFDRPGGVLGGLGQLGGQTPGAPGLGGLLGGLLGPLLGMGGGGGGGGGLFDGLGQLFQQAMRGPQRPQATFERPSAYVTADAPPGGGPAVVSPAAAAGANRPGVVIQGDDEFVEGEEWDECGYDVPPLPGIALQLGEVLGNEAMRALPFLIASHVISDALRETVVNPHRFGVYQPELSRKLRQWLRASDTLAAAAMGIPAAKEAAYVAAQHPEGESALKVASSLVEAY